MDRRAFLRSVGAISVLGFAGCSVGNRLVKGSLRDGKYDYDEILVDCYDELLENTIQFKTVTAYVSPFDGQTLRNEGHGVGFRKGNKLITVDHLFGSAKTPQEMEKLAVREGEKEMRIYLEGEELEVIHRDEQNDLAVLSFPEKYAGGLPLGDSDKLAEGNLISTVGVPYWQNKTIRLGRVVCSKGHEEMLMSRKVGRENVFLTWVQATPGDSGGPVYAFMDGRPEVTGMLTSLYRSYNENHKINHIKEVLKGYI